MWFAMVASLVLLAFVGTVFWSAWEPFSADMKESSPVVIVLTAIVAIIVLAPPVAWAIAGL